MIRNNNNLLTAMFFNTTRSIVNTVCEVVIVNVVLNIRIYNVNDHDKRRCLSVLIFNNNKNVLSFKYRTVVKLVLLSEDSSIF